MARIPASERDAFYESRRTELTQVALRLFAERGVDQTSVAAIASEAGISKGAFYLYFESKDALLEDVLRRNSLVPIVRTLVEDLTDKSLDDAIHGFVRGAWRYLLEHRELLLVLLRELPTQLERSQSLMQRVVVPMNRVLAGYLEERIDPARAEQLSLVISGRGLIGMIISVFLTQEILGAGQVVPVAEDQITSTLAELFLRGVTGSAPVGAPPC